jgi:polysaccharide biosynthesis protein PslA
MLEGISARPGHIGAIDSAKWPLRNVRLLVYSVQLAVDLVAIFAGFFLASTLRDAKWLTANNYHVVYFIAPIFVMFALSREAFSIASLRSLSVSVYEALVALFFTALLIMMITFFSQTGADFSRLAFGFGFFASSCLLGIGRWIIHQIVWKRYQGIVVDQLFINDGMVRLSDYGDMHYVDARAEHLYPDPNDPVALASISGIINRFDRVVVACPKEHQPDWARALKGSDVTGEIVVDQEENLGAIGVSECAGRDTLIVSRNPLNVVSRVQKRLFDLSVAAPLLLFLAPLMVIVAIIIRLESPGPILFRQPRVGRGNKTFSVYKFRSMRADMGDVDGTVSTQRDDNRITTFGRFIRKTSIDELPQLFNVLRGDMSVVGPRPHALGSLAGDSLFWQVNNHYWMRHALKPGITGLAQVRGHRGATEHKQDLEKRLQSDLEYVQDWSIWGDITILVRTVKVLTHPNAY